MIVQIGALLKRVNPLGMKSVAARLEYFLYVLVSQIN